MRLSAGGLQSCQKIPSFHTYKRLHLNFLLNFAIMYGGDSLKEIKSSKDYNKKQHTNIIVSSVDYIKNCFNSFSQNSLDCKEQIFWDTLCIQKVRQCNFVWNMLNNM